MKAWVRFGPSHTHVDAEIVRSNSAAAGIQFTVRETAYPCWVWGNAIKAAESEHRA